MGLTGCNDEAFDIDSVNKQTLLIMYPWSGTENSAGLYSDMVNNLNQIENAIKKNKGLKSTRVFVFMSTSATESSLFELTYNSSTFTVEHQMLENYTGNAYTTTEGLTEIIGEVKQQAEALNYALIIGGHGTGWNNISDWTNYPNQVKRKAALKTRSFGGLDNTYAINVSSLAQAIETNGIKMQYILFDACYMSNVETAYELKDATNFLLASPNEIMAKGLPYEDIWSYLNTTTPNYASIISSYHSHYHRTPGWRADRRRIHPQPVLRLGQLCRQSEAQRLNEGSVCHSAESHGKSRTKHRRSVQQHQCDNHHRQRLLGSYHQRPQFASRGSQNQETDQMVESDA